MICPDGVGSWEDVWIAVLASDSKYSKSFIDKLFYRVAIISFRANYANKLIRIVFFIGFNET